MKKQESKFSKDLFRELPHVLIRMNREIFKRIPGSLIILYVASVFSGSVASFLIRCVELKFFNHLQSGIIETVVPILLVYISVRTLPTIISELEYRLLHRVRQRINLGFQQQLIVSKAKLDIAYFETSKFNDELQNADKGLDSSQQMFIDQVAFFNGIFAMLTGLVAISFIGWQYAIGIILFTMPSFINMIIGDAKTYEHNNSKRVETRTSSYFAGMFGIDSIFDLKVFQLEKYFENRWILIRKMLQASDLDFQDKRTFTRIVIMLFATIGVGWIIYLIVMDGLHNKMQIGTMIFVLNGIAIARQSLFNATRNFTDIVGSLRYVRDYFKVLDAQPLVANKGITALDLSYGPEIEFENVSFRYSPGSPEVVKNVSFKVSSGTKIGIVGINGSGKNTLMGLLMRIYDPTEGRILVNGQDLKDLDLESYRSYIGFVAQKIKIPKAHTILQIIEMGDMRRAGTVSEKEWDQILNHSGVADFLPDMKDGINQMIGKEFPKGTQLSGGQEQRIAIARVLYRKPMMYVFDEPTSNFDPLIEDRFFTAFNELPEKATSFLISHSLRIVRNANTILVFEHGTLKEQGSHLELLQKSGIYAEMFHVQSKDYVRECYAQ